MGYVYNDGKKVDDKLEALRQAEIALEKARDLLRRARGSMFKITEGNQQLYADITNFLGD